MNSLICSLALGLLLVALGHAKLCWPGMDQTTWPCADTPPGEDMYPVYEVKPAEDPNAIRYQNIRGACTPCKLSQCDKTLRIEQDLQHCQWHVMPEFPRVYWQNTDGQGCKLCLDGRCEAYYGTFISPDECNEVTGGKKIFFQRFGDVCKPCYEGRCAMDIGQFNSKKECEETPKEFPGSVALAYPMTKLCITCFVSPCPPGLQNACDDHLRPLGKKFYHNPNGKGCYICFGAAKEGKPRKQGECVSKDQRWDTKQQCEVATGVVSKPTPTAPKSPQPAAPLNIIMAVKFQKTGPDGACEMCYRNSCAADIGTYDTEAECNAAPQERPFFDARSCVPYC